HELPAMLEHESDGAFLAQVAAALGKGMTYLGDSTGTLIRHAVDDNGCAANAIAFVADFFLIRAIGAACAALNGALDVVFGHIGGGRLVPRHAQAGIGVWIGPTGAGCHGDFAYDFCPELAALGVLATLTVLDIRPFTVSGH